MSAELKRHDCGLSKAEVGRTGEQDNCSGNVEYMGVAAAT